MTSHLCQSDSALERAAQAGWDYAEAREAALAASEGRRYRPITWENAHPLDHEEYRAYVRVIAEALDAA